MINLARCEKVRLLSNLAARCSNNLESGHIEILIYLARLSRVMSYEAACGTTMKRFAHLFPALSAIG